MLLHHTCWNILDDWFSNYGDVGGLDTCEAWHRAESVTNHQHSLSIEARWLCLIRPFWSYTESLLYAVNPTQSSSIISIPWYILSCSILELVNLARVGKSRRLLWHDLPRRAFRASTGIECVYGLLDAGLPCFYNRCVSVLAILKHLVIRSFLIPLDTYSVRLFVDDTWNDSNLASFWYTI